MRQEMKIQKRLEQIVALALLAMLGGVNGTTTSARDMTHARNQELTSPCILTSASTMPELYDLQFSTYIGGTGSEQIRDVCADSRGNVYITGGTKSPDFPTTPGAYDRSFDSSGTQVGSEGPMEVFVSKFDANGALIWSTFLGGPNYDRAYAIEVDDQGYVYVAGRAGPGFPVKNAFQPTFQGADQGIYGMQNAFIAKLEPDGSSVVWASYIGTGYLCRDLAIDADGDVYVPFNYLGSINPALPPAGWFQNAYQSTVNGGTELGVAKVQGDGSRVIWATWLGGSGDDGGVASIRVAADEHVYVAFNTESTDLPQVAGVWDQSYNGGADYYIARFTSDGSNLVFGTYLGGSGDEWLSTHNLAIDGQGNSYVSTPTASPNYPTTPGAFQRTSGGSFDIAVSKFSPTGTLIASTLIGGNGGENPDGIYADASGNVYVSGQTDSTNFPITTGAYQTSNHGSDEAIIVRLSADFGRLLYSTYMGGGAYDNGRSGFMDSYGNLYLAGASGGAGWPTKNAYQDAFAGGSGFYGSGDGIVARFSPVEGPQKRASAPSAAYGETLTYSIIIRDLAVPLTSTIHLTDAVPHGLAYVSGTFTATGGAVDATLAPILTWSGILTPTPIFTLTYAVTVTETSARFISNTVTIGAGSAGSLTRIATVTANGHVLYLPFALRGASSQ
jgi:uncharacterized repeat protein (TIGR01451 family)